MLQIYEIYGLLSCFFDEKMKIIDILINWK